MNKLVLVIDIQNEYIAEGRPYHIRGIEPALLNAKNIIDWARNANIPVWHVLHKGDNKVFLKDDPLSNPITGFEPRQEEPVFEKSMYSCFSSNALERELAIKKPDEIIVIGFGSSMCCLCTTIDGVHRGYSFTLVEDATASRAFSHASEDEMHTSAYNILKQYANVIRTSELVK